MDTPTPEQIEHLARLLNNLNTSTKQHGVGDLLAALFQRVTELEAALEALQTP